MNKKYWLPSALALAALAMPLIGNAEEAGAKEKCYGIAKASKNDCAANGHACAGQAKTDRDAKEWMFLPTGTCERILGGTLQPKQ